nr:LAGLIDADG family homing endonuclease [Paenibacillus xylanexedens]
MASYKNFQSDNFKHTKTSSRDGNNPDFNTVVKLDEKKGTSFDKNLEKWIQFVQWSKWFPDLFYDLISPEKGGMRLDLDQRVFLRSMSRFISTYGVFPRGFGKCVTGDTLIFTSQGIKEIGEYFEYNSSNIETFSKQDIEVINRYGKIEKTNAGVYSGYLPTKRVTTEEGYEVEATLNHPLLVLDSNGELVWKKTEDILVGDYLPIKRNVDTWGNKVLLNIDMSTYLEELSIGSRWKVEKCACNIPQILDEELSLILGYLVGDGCMTRHNSIMFSSKDNDMIERFTNYFQNVLGRPVVKKNDIDYLINGSYVRHLFKLLGLEQVNAYHKSIPKIILESTKKNVSAFIRGLFDTDGGISNSYIEYCTASEKLSKQVQTTLLNFGIVSTRTRKYNKKFNTYAYTLCIFGKNVDIFNKEIGFSCLRKQEKLNDICNNIKRNSNKDIIPYQQSRVNTFYQDVKKDNPYSYDKLYHVLKGNNDLTYEKLEFMLNLNDSHNSSQYNYFSNLSNQHYLFSRVKTVEDNQNHVYDLSLPETNSFVSNGIISHNTMIELMSIYHTCIFFPDITIAMSAQTRENASSISEEKHNEIIKWFPLMNNEIVKSSFSKDQVEVIFTSGAIYSVLANAQNSKGQRRRRLNVEESALLNNTLFKDALEPVVNVPRRTIGKLSTINPYELNGMINYLTTSGYRGSDEFIRLSNMIDEMAELKGKMVLGASWELPCHYGRGETRTQILAKKDDPTTSAISFAQNYESRWCGVSDGALVNINKLMELRTVARASLTPKKNREYYIGADIARSQSNNNNKSAFVVAEVERNSNGTIKSVTVANIFMPPNGTNFSDQAMFLKRLDKHYGGNVTVVDANGIGQGVVEELMKETYDPLLSDPFDSWDTINTDESPQDGIALLKIFSLKAQGIQTDIITNFIDFVESGRLRLLVPEKMLDLSNKPSKTKEKDTDVNLVKAAHFQTDQLIDQVANLKLVQKQGGKLGVDQVVKKTDKDIWAALAYVLYYLKNYEDVKREEEEVNYLDYFFT